MDIGMDFDLLDSDADKKSGQKRPRRRVIVDTKDANGRAYSAAEIRRMKRSALPALKSCSWQQATCSALTHGWRLLPQ